MSKPISTLTVRYKLINEGFSVQEFIDTNINFELDHGDLIICQESMQIAAYAKGCWLSVMRGTTLGEEV